MKKIWWFLKRYSREIIILLIGLITGAVFASRKKEEDILSEVGNEVDAIEAEFKEKADEVKRKLDMIKEIKDKRERMQRLLDLKKEIDEL